MICPIETSTVHTTYCKPGYTVVCYDADGRAYYHERRDLPVGRAAQLAVQVREAGQIDATRWECHVPYGSQAWLEQEAMVDQAQVELQSEWNAKFDYIAELTAEHHDPHWNDADEYA